MTELVYSKNDKVLLRTIMVVSVVVPLLVGVLMVMPYKFSLPKPMVMSLPVLNAAINSLTSVLLMIGLLFILQGKTLWHKRAMLGAMGLGAIFLISYVIYHASAPSTKYGDLNGDFLVDAAEMAAIASTAGIYYFVLLSHIVLAAIVLPFVLLAVHYALTGKMERHRKTVRWAYPIWLYVSVTGVVVYFMISPYYQ